MRLPLLNIRKYNSSQPAKAHSRSDILYSFTHFIQIYSTFVRQNPAESQSWDLIRKKVFPNKKCFEGFSFQLTVSSTREDNADLGPDCWGNIKCLVGLCFSTHSVPLSPLYIHIYILYNTAFSIINIKAAPDRSGLICLFILFRYDLCCSITLISTFLYFLNKHKHFPIQSNHTNYKVDVVDKRNIKVSYCALIIDIFIPFVFDRPCQ